METLQSVLHKIEALQERAKRLRAMEREAAIHRIVTAIRDYEITIEELFVNPMNNDFTPKVAPELSLPERKTQAPRGKLKNEALSKAMRARIKYADDRGNTWSGFGMAPKWIRNVKNRTKFLVPGYSKTLNMKG